MAKSLSNEEILAAINAARADSDSADASELVSDRADALDRYYGRPYGDEVEGRSAVVSRDVSDTVDWIMASLIRVFAGGDSPVLFNPVGHEDEIQAQQETDYVNHVVTQENPWFQVCHDWFKDALLLRNGYVKAYWESYKDAKYSEYTGLSVEQLALVVSDAAEIVEKRQREDGEGVVYDVKVREYEEGGQVCIEAVPAEELVVSRRCRGAIQDAPYVEHFPRKTRSDLIELGFSKDFVEGLPAKSARGGYDADALARDPVEGGQRSGSYSKDQDEVDYREVYIRLDADGDGVSELRRIVVCGNEIAPGKEHNREIDHIPFASLTPNRVPHRHVGRSVSDEVEDLAKIKTALTRMALDNAYIANNQRTVVNADNVNISDLLVSRPGGIIRTKGIPGQDVMPMPVMPIMGETLGLIAYMDSVKEFRTGVGRSSQGLDADTLKESTKGAYLAAVGQANQKIELIARMFAETGVKDLFLLVHGLLIKNQDKEAVVRLRNQWVPVDPRTWDERYDLTVSVGLGTGTTEERMQKVMMLGQGQAALAPYGLVGPKQAYESFSEGAKALGYKNPQKFAMDPESEEYKQMMANKPAAADPLTESKKIEVQGKLQAEQIRAQSEAPAKATDAALKKYDIDQRTAVEMRRAELDAANAAADRVAEARIAELDARVTLTVADMKNQVATIGQQLKAFGDAQNRMAIGGPAAANYVENGEAPEAPSLGQLFEGLQQSQLALAGGLESLAAGQAQMAEMLGRPKSVAIQRDSEGKAVGAVSKVQ